MGGLLAVRGILELDTFGGGMASLLTLTLLLLLLLLHNNVFTTGMVCNELVELVQNGF